MPSSILKFQFQTRLHPNIHQQVQRKTQIGAKQWMVSLPMNIGMQPCLKLKLYNRWRHEKLLIEKMTWTSLGRHGPSSWSVIQMESSRSSRLVSVLMVTCNHINANTRSVTWPQVQSRRHDCRFSTCRFRKRREGLCRHTSKIWSERKEWQE